jgi:glycine/D-amino acid oxidase-like deaminating enzyme
MSSGVPLPADLDRIGPRTDLLVVGAGTMGAWTAFHAQSAGDRRVALLDAWGVGHERGTSADETRITRAAHGADSLYPRWSRRALELWKRYQDEWGVQLFLPSGVLWIARTDDGFEAQTEHTFRTLGIPHERLPADELARRWPQVGVDAGVRFALYEPEGGALRARDGCLAVVGAFQRSGGEYGVASVRPGRTDGGRLLEVVDRSSRSIQADTFVFACGPWLRWLFPQVLGDVIRVTKQDLAFFGPPAGDRRFHWQALPAWCEYDEAMYGIGATEVSGLKIGPDRYGPVFDPTNGDRAVDPESIRMARAYLARRFPAMRDAPLSGTRVCQYETTLDAHFLICRHPDLDNVWLVGGGSGHGFKHGPRIGEYLVARLNGAAEGEQDGEAEQRFRLGPRAAGSAARTGADGAADRWPVA